MKNDDYDFLLNKIVEINESIIQLVKAQQTVIEIVSGLIKRTDALAEIAVLQNEVKQ